MSLFLYALYTVLNLGLLAWGLWLWRRTHWLSTLLIVLVTFGLVYDNFILLLGGFMQGGQLLFALSLPRFSLHQLVLPWIMLLFESRLSDVPGTTPDWDESLQS